MNKDDHWLRGIADVPPSSQGNAILGCELHWGHRQSYGLGRFRTALAKLKSTIRNQEGTQYGKNYKEKEYKGTTQSEHEPHKPAPNGSSVHSRSTTKLARTG